MHHIHTTQGFVVQSRNHGEANKIIYIFTRDLGLVVAIAQGIRFEKSKLRYNIRDYNFSKFSLIQGREFWRITGAEELFLSDEHVLQTDLTTGSETRSSANRSSAKYYIMSRVALVILRLVHGEEKHQEIYDCLWNFANFQIDNNCSQEFLATAESLLVVRILHRLGYIADNSEFGKEIIGSDFQKEIIDRIITKRVDINRAINNALRESHL